MGRTSANPLTIRPHGDTHLLFGYFRGEKIRVRGAIADLIGRKRDMELELEAEQERGTRAVRTWLSEEQLRDAEAATTLAAGRSLIECVKFAPAPVKGGPELRKALEEFWKDVAKLNRRGRTVDNLDSRIGAFLIGQGFAKPFAKRFSRKRPSNGHTWEADEGVRLAEVLAAAPGWIWRESVSDRTRINDLLALNRVFRFWKSKGWVNELPSVDRKLFRPRPADPKILTPDQCAALLRACTGPDKDMLPFVVLGLWGFIRPKELSALSWDDVDFKPELRVRVGRAISKTSHFRVVQLPAGCAKLLKPLAKGGKVAPQSALDEKFRRIRHTAGLLESWQNDLMRHTGISYHYAKTGDLKETCRKAGNSTDVLFRHYLALATKETAVAFYDLV